MRRNWVIAPYENSNEHRDAWDAIWESNLKNNVISIGWSAIGDPTNLSVSKIAARILKNYDYSEQGAHNSAVLIRKFYDEINIGDIIIARRGTMEIVGMGEVTKRAKYSANKFRAAYPHDPFPNHLGVKWNEFHRQFTKPMFGIQTIHTIDDEKLEELTGISSDSEEFPNEVSTALFPEGAVTQVMVNKYERQAKAKRLCLKIHGTKCCACGFDFEVIYGDHGKGFIHVHHLVPISQIGESYQVDPKTDLKPVCPNCHAMIHRKKTPLSISELCAILKRKS